MFLQLNYQSYHGSLLCSIYLSQALSVLKSNILLLKLMSLGPVLLNKLLKSRDIRSLTIHY